VPVLDDVYVAFPSDAMDWMPPFEQIPEEFKSGRGDATVWVEIVESWFAVGLPETVSFYPRPGVDAAMAFRALHATLGSFAPKHQHKIAAAAYMASCWFERVEGWTRKEEVTS
jgi:hypothetical protein